MKFQPIPDNLITMDAIAYFFKSAPILILSAISIVFLEFSATSVFYQIVGYTADSQNVFWNIFYLAYSLFCLLITPVAFSKLLHQTSLRAIGLNLPEDKQKALYLILTALLFCMPTLYLFIHSKTVQLFYTQSHLTLTQFIFIQSTALPLYYFAEEFFFRGFLFLNLWKKIGWHSFWVTDLIFIWAHFFKPIPEILYSIPVGIILNYITLKTKSIYPAIIVHGSIAICNNIIINYWV